MAKRKKLRKRRYNPQRPPRRPVVIALPIAVYEMIADAAHEDEVSVSRWLTNFVCVGFDIPEDQR